MRCNDCNLMVSTELADPEVELVAESNEVAGTVRLVLTCAECGTELVEATHDVSESLADLHEDAGEEGHEIEVEVSSEEATEEKRKGRKYVGYRIEAKVTCECGWSDTLHLEDAGPQAEMEEL